MNVVDNSIIPCEKRHNEMPFCGNSKKNDFLVLKAWSLRRFSEITLTICSFSFLVTGLRLTKINNAEVKKKRLL